MYPNSNHASLFFLHCSFIQQHSVHYDNQYVAFCSQENNHLWYYFTKNHIIFPGEQPGTQNNALNQMSFMHTYRVRNWSCSVCVCVKKEKYIMMPKWQPSPYRNLVWVQILFFFFDVFMLPTVHTYIKNYLQW
jgi:hypothetical protein